jgi:4-diphosphocytidyl-2-C-methyl-D-erythritol kinase
MDLPERWYVVLDPGVHVPTADLFRSPELTRDCRHLTIPLFVSGVATSNVFEPVVRARFPEVARALDWLNGHAAARLSGSGGCILAPVDSREAGLDIVRACPQAWRGFVARGVAHSPLLARLREWRAART